MAPAWYVAPCLEQLRAELNTRWPGRDRTSDGGVGDTSHAARVSDHNPDWTAGGVVRARDFDEDGIPTALLLREAITDPRTNYVIYERLLYLRGRGFKPVAYTGINPHDHHMHISIRHGAQWENDRTPWITDAVLVSHTVPVQGIDIPTPAPLPVLAPLKRRRTMHYVDPQNDRHYVVTDQNVQIVEPAYVNAATLQWGPAVPANAEDITRLDELTRANAKQAHANANA